MNKQLEVKPKKKRVDSKAKGNSFESKIAKALTASLPINFQKSVGSGAKIGGMNFATIGKMMGEEVMKLFNADVVPMNEEKAGYKFKYSIECKSYKTPDSFTTLVAGTANVFKWFQESVVDSAKIDRHPILIFKWNFTPIFVALRHGAEAPIAPKLHLSNTSSGLDIYDFNELLKFPDFWVTKI